MQHKDKAYSTLHIARKMKAKGIFLKEAGFLKKKKMKMDNVGFQSSLLIYIISNTYHLIEHGTIYDRLNIKMLICSFQCKIVGKI